MSEADRERVARQAAIRTIRSGQRPVYRILVIPDGSWNVLGYPWLAIDANDRRSALGGDEGGTRYVARLEP